MYALDLLKVGFAHLYALSANIYKHSGLKANCSNLRTHLDNLCILYCLCNVRSDLSGLYECGYLSSGSSLLIEQSVKRMLSELRPQILNLIEAFNYSDNILMSAVGNSYGDIYETHLAWAKSSRLNDNKGSIPDGYEEYLKPILQGKM